MGNATSRSGKPRVQSDLDALSFSKATGLYPYCPWSERLVRRLILRGRVAPRYPGADEPTEVQRDECLICFLYYPMLNSTVCCGKQICTECFLQIRPPKLHHSEDCPFCKTPSFDISFKGPKSSEQRRMEELEEQRVMRAWEAAQRQNCEHEEDHSLLNLMTSTSKPTQSLKEPRQIPVTNVLLPPELHPVTFETLSGHVH
uniref:RING-type domain-containing protein n=1 Tax=Compsopogon caeruleus TaxID=31354 RepID=A0A7S1TCU7_9RHOD